MTRQDEIRRRMGERVSRTRGLITVERRPRHEFRSTAEWRAALHVTNGDCTVPALSGTGIAERDPRLARRPARGPGPGRAGRRAAAPCGRRSWADDPRREAGARRRCGARRSRSATPRSPRGRDGEYVLWFEADLYDQLQLVQILARLRALGVPPDRITLVCIGEYPGIAHFGGLGELDAWISARGRGRSAPRSPPPPSTTPAGAWAAFRAPHPTGLGAIAATPSPRAALRRRGVRPAGPRVPVHAGRPGLAERRVLAAVAAGAPTAGAAFVRAAAREARPYLGDLCASAPSHASSTRRSRFWRRPTRRRADRPGDRADRHRRRPARAARGGRPRRAERDRPLDRRRPPGRRRGRVALGRGHGGGRRRPLTGRPHRPQPCPLRR